MPAHNTTPNSELAGLCGRGGTGTCDTGALDGAASQSGRSLAQEFELRLEASFAREEAVDTTPSVTRASHASPNLGPTSRPSRSSRDTVACRWSCATRTPNTARSIVLWTAWKAQQSPNIRGPESPHIPDRTSLELHTRRALTESDTRRRALTH